MIEFRNVSKVYNNGTEALHNINLKVEKGEFVFIVGSSGAGKSTFLKLITCEERPNEGQVLIDGQDISHIRKGKIPYVRRKMGLVFQDFRLIDHMTVYDNVAFAMRVVGASPKAIKKRVPYILGLVGLQHKAKHYPTEMSGGERQRVGLARALVNNPSMIIADEPTQHRPCTFLRDRRSAQRHQRARHYRADGHARALPCQALPQAHHSDSQRRDCGRYRCHLQGAAGCGTGRCHTGDRSRRPRGHSSCKGSTRQGGCRRTAVCNERIHSSAKQRPGKRLTCVKGW